MNTENHVDNMYSWYDVTQMAFIFVVFLCKTHDSGLITRKMSDEFQ